MCNCIETVNTMLKERNTALLQPLFMTGTREGVLLVETYQIESGRSKKKKCSMFTSYCPFCGEKHPEPLQ